MEEEMSSRKISNRSALAGLTSAVLLLLLVLGVGTACNVIDADEVEGDQCQEEGQRDGDLVCRDGIWVEAGFRDEVDFRMLGVDEIGATGARFEAALFEAPLEEELNYGFCWDRQPEATLDEGECRSRGAAAIGTFEHETAALLPGRDYFVRAYITNGKDVAYTEELSFTTEAPAISDLEADHGAHQDFIELRWQGVHGAAAYLIERDGEEIAQVDGEVSSFVDDALEALLHLGTPANLAATAGEEIDFVRVSWDTDVEVSVQPVSYEVTVIYPDVDGPKSDAVEGVLADSQEVTFELERDGVWHDVGTAQEFEDSGAPPAMIDAGELRASQATYLDYVALEIDDHGVIDGAAREYRVRARVEGLAGQASPPVEGWRGAGVMTVAFEVDVDGQGNWEVVEDGEIDQTRDYEAPVDGTPLVYRARVRADGAATQTTALAQGYRAERYVYTASRDGHSKKLDTDGGEVDSQYLTVSGDVRAVALDEEGNIYSAYTVANGAGWQIQKRDADGAEEWSGGYIYDGTIRVQVDALAVDDEGYAFVLTSVFTEWYGMGHVFNHSVAWVLSANGVPVYEEGIESEGRWFSDLAVGPDDALYLASNSVDFGVGAEVIYDEAYDGAVDRLQRSSVTAGDDDIDSWGVWSVTLSGAITTVASDGEGNAYLGYGHRLQKYSDGGLLQWNYDGADDEDRITSIAVGDERVAAGWRTGEIAYLFALDGAELWTYSGPGALLRSLTIDQWGNVYSGWSDNEVRRIDDDGQFHWSFGGHGSDVFDVVVEPGPIGAFPDNW